MRDDCTHQEKDAAGECSALRHYAVGRGEEEEIRQRPPRTSKQRVALIELKGQCTVYRYDDDDEEEEEDELRSSSSTVFLF
jgi:hypothetical protein